MFYSMAALIGGEDEMKRRHHTPGQIVRKLREANRKLGEGFPMVEVCKHLEVTEQRYYRWRNQYGRDESAMMQNG
jgi:transposase-like protein